MQVVIADPSTVALDPAPIELGWIVKGAPQAHAKELARSADGTAIVMAWSCTAGQFHWHYSVDEILHVISGEAFITNRGGAERRLGPGDMAFFPAGSHSLWRVPCACASLPYAGTLSPSRLDLPCAHGKSSSPRQGGSSLTDSHHAASAMEDTMVGAAKGNYELVAHPAAGCGR
jgi:uncharacterized protein